MINGNFQKNINIVHAYANVGFNVCTPTYMVYTLNYNGGGYNFIAELIKHDRIHTNPLISEHDVDINLRNILYGRTKEFDFASNHKSIKLWSYSG